VRDQGCGIGREHLPRIFERFYRVDKAAAENWATGLGLAIVKHIAQAHGGRATVESSIGQGSVFSIHLPPQRRKKWFILVFDDRIDDLACKIFVDRSSLCSPFSSLVRLMVGSP